MPVQKKPSPVSSQSFQHGELTVRVEPIQETANTWRANVTVFLPGGEPWGTGVGPAPRGFPTAEAAIEGGHAFGISFFNEPPFSGFNTT